MSWAFILWKGRVHIHWSATWRVQGLVRLVFIPRLFYADDKSVNSSEGLMMYRATKISELKESWISTVQVYKVFYFSFRKWCWIKAIPTLDMPYFLCKWDVWNVFLFAFIFMRWDWLKNISLVKGIFNRRDPAQEKKKLRIAAVQFALPNHLITRLNWILMWSAEGWK